MSQCIEAGCGRQAMRHHSRCEHHTRLNKDRRSAQEKSYPKCAWTVCNNVVESGQAFCRAHREPPEMFDPYLSAKEKTVNDSLLYNGLVSTDHWAERATNQATKDITMDPIFERFTDGRKFFRLADGTPITTLFVGYNAGEPTVGMKNEAMMPLHVFDSIAGDELALAMLKDEFWVYTHSHPQPCKATRNGRAWDLPDVEGTVHQRNDAWFRAMYEEGLIKLCDPPAEPDLEAEYRTAYKAWLNATNERNELLDKIKRMRCSLPDLKTALEDAEQALLRSKRS